MTFTLPSVTAILALTIAAAVVGVLTMTGALTAFLVRNHGIRVARHQSIPTYYRELAFSH